MAEPFNGANNSNVTLAIVQRDIQALGKQLDTISQQLIKRQDEQDARLRDAEDWCVESAEKWRGHADLHRTERGVFTVAGAVATAVASAIGVFVKG